MKIYIKIIATKISSDQKKDLEMITQKLGVNTSEFLRILVTDAISKKGGDKWKV